MRVQVVAIAVIALVALLVGCGGGSGSVGSTVATSSSKAPTGESGGASSGREETERGGSAPATGKGTGKGGSEANQAGKSPSGSSGVKPAPKTGPLTKTEFISEGDGICNNVTTEYQVKAIELKEEKGKGQEPSTAETNLKAAVPPLYVAVEAFEALTPPKGEEKQAEALISALEKAAKGLEAKPESELVGPKSPFAEFQKLAQKYGFQVCPEL